MCPRIEVQNGTQFPREGSGETASRSGLENWDAVSAQTEEGTLSAVDADSAPFALSFVEV